MHNKPIDPQEKKRMADMLRNYHAIVEHSTPKVYNFQATPTPMPKNPHKVP